MGVKINWPSVGNVIPLSGEKPKVVVEDEIKEESQPDLEEEGSTSKLDKGKQKMIEEDQEEELEDEDMAMDKLTWSDVALAIGAEIVNTCRNSVQSQLGYTCSAGIAPNKVSYF